MQISVQLVQTVFCLDYAKSLSLYQLRESQQHILYAYKHKLETSFLNLHLNPLREFVDLSKQLAHFFNFKFAFIYNKYS